jgi:hypothetical protein
MWILSQPGVNTNVNPAWQFPNLAGMARCAVPPLSAAQEVIGREFVWWT